MTREEAYTKALSIDRGEIINKIIDMVYDDFENRSCANCKHWKTFNSGEYDFVMCHNTNSCSCEWETDKDFCCNKWQEK